MDTIPCTDHVASWVAQHTEIIGGVRTKFAKDTTYGPKFCAWFESASHVIDIGAWDWTDCLDIQILDFTSGEIVFSEAGECDGPDGITARLERFLARLRQLAALPLAPPPDGYPLQI